jgi:hypothetical protein
MDPQPVMPVLLHCRAGQYAWRLVTDKMADLPPAARRISAVQAGWRTARTSLRVLVVIHNVTAATRLADILPVFHDRRVQLFCTQTSDAMFANGVSAYVRAQGFLCLTWEQAISLEFDVVVTASLGDNLHELRSPILRLPHGNGYNKYPGAGSREPGAGSREPGAGSREPGSLGCPTIH